MAEQITDNQKFTGVRLPTNIKPQHYKVSLKPNLSQFTFEGTVEIEYQAEPQTSSIIVHANEIEIFEGSITHSGATRSLSRVTYSKDAEVATLEFADGKAIESGTLKLLFRGTLNDKLKGFYRSAFELEGETVYAATTQFEATEARRCFPCWDEPAVKSTFSVSLIIDPTMTVKGKNYTRVALSNMPEVSRVERNNGEVEVFFDKSPIMSTYLLAFIVGPFEMIEGTDGKRPIRVYTTPGKRDQGKFALNVACKSLPYYEDYFGIEYPLPKMDLIAIPDFAFGAMENWGLVTYRETALLFDPNNTSTARKQIIALVVAHELAHQWFGNLVTMQWWTHLWLNEGFATFMEFLCVDHIFPEYDIWSQFLADDYGRAMELDSLHNSHPIEVTVNHPSEIEEIFDEISYEKGASVIRMLYHYIGDELFRKGMSAYLTKFAYKNAVTEDLWAALEAASNKPVSRLMTGWTSKKGYPWLSVSASSDGDQVKLTLEQSKFTADGKLQEGDESATWLIPISATSGAKPTEPTDVSLLESKTGEIRIEGAGDTWIKLNPGTISLYRTAYPPDMAQKLLPAIIDQSLPPTDRLGLQSDFFALCQAGKVNTVELLTLLQAFKTETNYTVWNSIASCMSKLSTLVANTDYKDTFQAFGRNLYADIFKKVTWIPQPNEKHTDALTRATVISELVGLQDEAVLAEAQQMYRAHLAKSRIIPADLRGAVYKAISTHGDDQLFESLFQIHQTADLQEEKMRVARAVGFSRDPARLERAIKFAFSDQVRNQDRVFWILPIGLSNPPVAFKVIQDQKDFLREKYGSGGILSRMIKGCLENLTTEEEADEVDQFFQANKFPGAERVVQQALETIRLNAGWIARDGDAIKAFLSK